MFYILLQKKVVWDLTPSRSKRKRKRQKTLDIQNWGNGEENKKRLDKVSNFPLYQDVISKQSYLNVCIPFGYQPHYNKMNNNQDNHYYFSHVILYLIGLAGVGVLGAYS